MQYGGRFTWFAGLGLILGAYWLFARVPSGIDDHPEVEASAPTAPAVEPPALDDREVERAAAPTVEPRIPEANPPPPRLEPDPAAPRPQLRIRLLRPDRSPIVDTDVAISREENRAGRSTSIGTVARTDGFGILRFDWTEFLEGTVRSVQFHAPAAAEEYQGELALSRPLALDEDLGELVLGNVPFLASGIVLDEFGRGVPNAEVFVVARTGGFGSPLTWVKNEGTTRRSAADGTFRLVVGELWGDVLSLAARHPEFGLCERVEFERGATGIELRLMRCATVTGSILLPEGLPAAMLDVSLLAPDEIEGTFGPPRLQSKVSDEGRFELRDVLPGTYRFVLTGNHPQTLLRIPDIVVTRPPYAQDPRLQAIPLGNTIQALRVEVVDASGRPIDATLLVRERGWESSIGAYRVERGVFVVPDVPAGQDLLVTAHGFQPVWRKDVRAEANPRLRIALEPALRRTFVFDGEFPLRANGRRIAVVLAPSSSLIESRSETVLGLQDLKGEIASGRTLELAIPFPGEYSLSLAVRDGEGIFAVDQTIETRPLLVDDAPTAVIRIAESPALRTALDG